MACPIRDVSTIKHNRNRKFQKSSKPVSMRHAESLQCVQPAMRACNDGRAMTQDDLNVCDVNVDWITTKHDAITAEPS